MTRQPHQFVIVPIGLKKYVEKGLTPNPVENIRKKHKRKSMWMRYKQSSRKLLFSERYSVHEYCH